MQESMYDHPGWLIATLLHGFTFKLSLQRYDSRAQAVVNEANAIGTAMRRGVIEVSRQSLVDLANSPLAKRHRAAD